MKIKLNLKNILVSLGIFSLILLGYFSFLHSKNNSKKPSGPEIIVYKDPNCQCCDFWVSYLEKNGFKVKVESVSNLEPVKDKYGIPSSLRSCHTALIDGYIVEGHVPIEAINKLLTEKPKIKGIALPGMPAGSPGMGGLKQAPFEIFSFGEKGISKFITL